jgi:uncharacterized phage-like protein YoqJ
MKIYAATGHRPDKLGGYSRGIELKLEKLALRYLIKKKPDKIISGMAQGWDLAWATAGLELGIPVIAAIPFVEQSTRWPEESRERYSDILQRCTEVKYVCISGYAPWKMQVRNRWMVDNCTKLVALWNGSSGGTANCIEYAKSVNRRIFNLWPRWEKLAA